MTWVKKATEQLQKIGFSNFGFAELKEPRTLAIYRTWLEQGYQGDMTYLQEHLGLKSSPQSLLKKARAAIVVSYNYVPHPFALSEQPLKHLRQALYARGEDYHIHFKQKLLTVANNLQTEFIDDEFLVTSDSHPLLERDLAYSAGLGWFGKNTCLIHPKEGSLFFLGQILTTLPAPTAARLVTDHCGTCTRCLDACPTGALRAPRQLDARLCISYLTIEAKSVAQEHLRTKIGDWFFGCDICQTVCPWNIKWQGSYLQDPPTTQNDLVADLRWVLSSSNQQLQKTLQKTALMRARGSGLKRNALILVANLKLKELEPQVKNLATHPKLGELAHWVLHKLR